MPSPKPVWPLLLTVLIALLVGSASVGAYHFFVLAPQMAALKMDLSEELHLIAQQLSTTSSRPTLPSTPTSPTPIQIDPRFVESNEGLALAARSSMVGSLRRHSLAAKPEDPLSNQVGQVISITADGWLVTAHSAIGTTKLSDLFVVIQDRAYELEKGYKDLSTGLAYLKIQARDLPVASFASASDVSRGQLVFAEPWQRWELQTISSIRSTEDVNPVVSEYANRRFLITGAALKNRTGMAIWDRAGRLVGIGERTTDEGWVVIPASFIDVSLSAIISDGMIKRASLGVRSQELSTLTSEPNKANPANRGAWIKPNHTLPAVTVNGPAAKFLQEGDVVQRIDRDILDGTADLGEHLLEYRPGSTVTIYGLRKGSPFTATVQLGSVTTSEAIK